MKYNNGMASPLNDKDYFNFMTNGGSDKIAVATLLRYYPDLQRFM
jgi:hypothetical protein